MNHHIAHSPEKKLQTFTLSNGLRVVLLPKHTAPVVAVAVTYQVGSYSESLVNTGFAHFFEHLMFEGSENVAHGMFDRYCTGAGGENNAYTTFDKTTYYMSLPAHQLELGLWLEADRMGAFGIDEKAFEIQKNVVLEEINQNVENAPYGTFARHQNNLAFAEECGYHWEVYGNPEHVANSTLQDVRQFYSDFYRPDNACLVVCGDCAITDARRLVEQYFGAIPRGNGEIRRKLFHSETYRKGSQYRRVEDAIPVESLFLAFHGEGFCHNQIFVAEVLSSIVSDGISSRLYKSLVYEQQIASEITSYLEDRQFTSLFNIYAIANGADYSCEQLYQAVLKELQNIQNVGVTEEEVNKAKNRINTRLARSQQRVNGIADELAHQTLFFADPARTFRLIDFYDGITAEDVLTYARTVCVPENQIRLDFVPHKEKVG